MTVSVRCEGLDTLWQYREPYYSFTRFGQLTPVYKVPDAETWALVIGPNLEPKKIGRSFGCRVVILCHFRKKMEPVHVCMYACSKKGLDGRSRVYLF